MPGHATGLALEALVRAECDAIVQALRAPRALHTRVHEARKAVRRARALLALARDGGASFDLTRVDRRLQRVGDGLSRLRDAHAALETARQLAKQEGRKPWRPVIQALQARSDALAARELARDPGLSRRQAAVQDALRQLGRQPWGELSAAQLRAGLQHQRRRAEHAARRAKRHPDAEHLHRWRRRVRRLRMQVDALPRLKQQGTVAGPKSRSLHRLSDALGWRQDLHVLSGLLRRLPGIPQRQVLRDRLHALAAEAPPPD